MGLALGFSGPALLGVVIIAPLPTAQNILLHATRYRVGEGVAHETILVTTLLSPPVALVVAVLVGQGPPPGSRPAAGPAWIPSTNPTSGCA